MDLTKIPIEKIQEELDTGVSVNKAATTFGLHRQTVHRLIERGQLHIYNSFDEEQDQIQLAQNFEWLYEEDMLEKFFSKAYEEYYLLIPILRKYSCEEGVYQMFVHLKQTYGNVYHYLKRHEISFLAEFIFKKCRVCYTEKRIVEFNLNAYELDGIESRCRGCFNKKYGKRCPKKTRMSINKRRASIKRLPSRSFSWENLKQEFRSRCALTGKQITLHADHFIALSTGHGGTYLENLIPISQSVNSSKGNSNPFEWILTRPELCIGRFNDVVDYLAEKNGLTPDEFRQYVNWCYENPRKNGEIKEDNARYGYTVSSLEVWREATGIQFPIRIDFKN